MQFRPESACSFQAFYQFIISFVSAHPSIDFFPLADYNSSQKEFSFLLIRRVTPCRRPDTAPVHTLPIPHPTPPGVPFVPLLPAPPVLILPALTAVPPQEDQVCILRPAGRAGLSFPAAVHLPAYRTGQPLLQRLFPVPESISRPALPARAVPVQSFSTAGATIISIIPSPGSTALQAPATARGIMMKPGSIMKAWHLSGTEGMKTLSAPAHTAGSVLF